VEIKEIPTLEVTVIALKLDIAPKRAVESTLVADV
jgi:hypothetical protein